MLDVIAQKKLRFLESNVVESEGNSIKGECFGVGSIFLPTSGELESSVEMSRRDFAGKRDFLVELFGHLHIKKKKKSNRERKRIQRNKR